MRILIMIGMATLATDISNTVQHCLINFHVVHVIRQLSEPKTYQILQIVYRVSNSTWTKCHDKLTVSSMWSWQLTLRFVSFVFTMNNQLRSQLKKHLFIICTVCVFPLIAGVFVIRQFSNDRSFFQGSSQLLSIVPFRIGVYLRAAFYKNTCNNVDREVNIGFMTLLSHSDVDIHKNTYIGGQCNIAIHQYEIKAVPLKKLK